MEVNIKQWNKYKDRIADELYKQPFDWLDAFDKIKVIQLFNIRLKSGLI